MAFNLSEARKLISKYPQVRPVDENPPLIVYEDSDGYLYNYTIFNLTLL